MTASANFCARRATALGFVSAIALSAASTPAYAQSGETAATTDEIIVSARRRDESLQDVPIAVSAFDGDKLENMGAVDLKAKAQVFGIYAAMF